MNADQPGREQLPLRGRGLQDSPFIEGLRGLSLGISREGHPPPGLVEPSSSKACFSQRYTKHMELDQKLASLNINASM